MAELLAVRGMDTTSPAFRRRLIRMSERLEADPDDVGAVMSFETAGSMSPAQKHLGGGSAVGLIQFMPPTAKALGTTRDELLAMSGVEQLVYVEKYLAPAKGSLRTTADVYMAVFAPIGMGKAPGFPLYRCGGEGKRADGTIDVEKCSRSYSMNRRLDANADGIITKREAAIHPIGIKAAAGKRPRIQVDMSVADNALQRRPGALISLDEPGPGRTLAGLAAAALAALGAAFAWDRYRRAS